MIERLHPQRGLDEASQEEPRRVAAFEVCKLVGQDRIELIVGERRSRAGGEADGAPSNGGRARQLGALRQFDGPSANRVDIRASAARRRGSTEVLAVFQPSPKAREADGEARRTRQHGDSRRQPAASITLGPTKIAKMPRWRRPLNSIAEWGRPRATGKEMFDRARQPPNSTAADACRQRKDESHLPEAVLVAGRRSSETNKRLRDDGRNDGVNAVRQQPAELGAEHAVAKPTPKRCPSVIARHRACPGDCGSCVDLLR